MVKTEHMHALVRKSTRESDTARAVVSIGTLYKCLNLGLHALRLKDAVLNG